ncbi:MAG: DUF2325 domain-containing protein [Desulfotalea sp.]
MKKIKSRMLCRLKIRKIWELPHGYQCSVIGTCLNDRELKKINLRKDINGGTFSSSFELHNRFVNFAYSKCKASITMHNLLVNKYRLQLSIFHKVCEDEQLDMLWEEAKENGKIAGAYWAMCTHPHISSDLLTKYYGEIHMISHDSVQTLNRAKKQIDKLRTKEIKLQAENIAIKNKLIHKNDLLNSELNTLKVITSTQNKLPAPDFIPEIQKPNYNDNQKQIHNLQNKNKGLLTQLNKVESTLTSQELLITQLKIELQNQKEENIKIEKNILTQLTNNCQDCDAVNTCSCPGINLCGKIVLYVGGQHKMIPHYKKLIEKNGGSFIHHDGGKEESKKKLPGMLVQADAVMCPIDCISHNACLTVKKLCKYYQKQYVMMRTSGLSSLANGLEKLN